MNPRRLIQSLADAIRKEWPCPWCTRVFSGRHAVRFHCEAMHVDGRHAVPKWSG